jgi:aquaporin Z
MITPMVRKLVAELVGTFILVFAGTGAIVINHESGGVITHVGVALTFGLVVFALIQMLGDVSGAQLNPAVTTGLVLARRFPPQEAIPYITAQCLGAFLASGLLKILFPADATLGATLPAGSAFQSFALEFTLTAILMLTILRATTGAPGKVALAGAAIGSVIALDAMFAGPACGASMNPARSLAPAIVSGQTSALWIYLVAPMLGAALGVLVELILTIPTYETTIKPERIES